MKYYLIFFGILSTIFLMVCNADLLYMVQERSLFMSSSVFLTDCLRTPGGLLTWLALWFTQFFYYPWLGGSMLVGLWLVICLVLQRTFRPVASWSWLVLIPVVALLVSTIDLGYWIYILKQQGYWFRETLGILFVSLLLALQGAKNQSYRTLIASAIALAVYPFVGYHSLLALVCILARRVTVSLRQTHSGWLLTTLITMATLIVPPVIARFYSTIRVEDAYLAGFAMIESNTDCSWVLTLPFIVVALSMLALCVCPLQKPLHLMPQRQWLMPSVIMTLLALIVFERNYSDRNYHAEMRMYRQVEEYRWKEVLQEMEEAGKAGGSTRQMAMCKDLALINTQRIDLMFQFSNGDQDRVMRDSCGVYMLHSAGPLLAIGHGMTNTATHWGIENVVEYGFNVTGLKVLTLAALINGESRLADKYLTMLSQNLFQSAWVKRYRPLVVYPELIDQYQELTVMRLLHDYPVSELNGDSGDVEADIFKAFSNFVNFELPSVQELSVYYALREKNPMRFWTQIKYYIQNNPGQPLPIVFQEAAHLFQTLNPNETAGVHLRIAPEISKGYDAFNQYASTHARPDMSQAEIGAVMKPKFGKTYWWYYYFNRTTHY